MLHEEGKQCIWRAARHQPATQVPGVLGEKMARVHDAWKLHPSLMRFVLFMISRHLNFTAEVCWCRLLSCTEGGQARLHEGTWSEATKEAGTGSCEWKEAAQWQPAKVPVCCTVCPGNSRAIFTRQVRPAQVAGIFSNVLHQCPSAQSVLRLNTYIAFWSARNTATLFLCKASLFQIAVRHVDCHVCKQNASNQLPGCVPSQGNGP